MTFATGLPPFHLDNQDKLPKLKTFLVAVAIVASGLFGWGVIRAGQVLYAPTQELIADRTGHRPPPPPPLPTSPFQTP